VDPCLGTWPGTDRWVADHRSGDGQKFLWGRRYCLYTLLLKDSIFSMDIGKRDSLCFKLQYTPTMPSRSILTINPNSTRSMTDALVPLVDDLAFNEVGSGLPTNVPALNRTISDTNMQ
jgi:hypothetical protein